MNRERLIIEGRLAACRRELTEVKAEARAQIGGLRERLTAVVGRELDELDIDGCGALWRRLEELIARLRRLRAEMKELEAELN